MATRALPFLVSPKTEIRAIGTPDIGIIHLTSKGGISPNENPVDLQAAGTRQARTQLIIQNAIKNLAEKENISKAAARKRLFDLPIKDATQAGSAADVEVVEEDVPSLYDYLSPEEATELLNLREDTASIAIKAATLFIRYRVVYPVQLSVSAKAKATSIAAELGFPIADGQKLKFGYQKVEVDGAHDVGAEEIAVKSLKNPIEEGAIGYLCEFESGKLKVGDAEWSEDDTRSHLTEELILRIYDFYQQELTGLSPEEAQTQDDDLGKSLAPSSSAA